MQKVFLVINLILTVTLFTIVFVIWSDKPIIVSVDSVKLLNEFVGTQKAKMQFKKKEDNWKANLDTLNNEVARQRLFNERNFTKMSPTERANSYDLLRKKELQFQQYKDAIDTFIQQEEEKLTSELIKEIDVFVKDYGEKNGYSIIIGANQFGNVVYTEESYDITEDLLYELNKKYK
jgi:outer membrane protein